MPDSTGAKPTCFIAMPITTSTAVAERYNGDDSHWEHVMEVLFVPAIEKAGYDAVKPIAQGGEMIHAHIVSQLTKADMVLCDLSTLNPNVMFEFGIRTALNRPIAVVAEIEKTFRLPFDTNSINTHFYAGSIHSWDLPSQIEQLAEYIDATREKSDDGNQFWHYFGLTLRAKEPVVKESPEEAALDLKLAAIDQRLDSVVNVVEQVLDLNAVAAARERDKEQQEALARARTAAMLKRLSANTQGELQQARARDSSLARTTHDLLVSSAEEIEKAGDPPGIGQDALSLLAQEDIFVGFDLPDDDSMYLIYTSAKSLPIIGVLRDLLGHRPGVVYVIRQGEELRTRRILSKM